MGLLGSDFSDPQTLAVLQLAGGLLSPGSFGQGLSRGLTGYQSALVNAQDMAAKKQAMDLQNIQMQQQKRLFELQTPFMEEALREMQQQGAQGASAPPPNQGPPAPMSQSMMFSPQENAERATQTQTPFPAPPPRRSMFPNVPNSVAFPMIGAGGFGKLPDLIMKYNEPTEFTKMLNAAGIDPQSPEGQAAIRANIAKSNYVAPVNARPGSILRHPFTQQPVAFNPQVPNGATPVFDASGNVAGFNEIPNAFSLLEKGSRAKTAGEGSVLPYAGVDKQGNQLPVTNRTAAATQGRGAAVVTPDQQTSANAEQLRIMLDERKTAKPGPDRDALDREINRVQNAMLKRQPFSASTGASAAPQGGIYAAPPLGAETTAKESAKDVVANYNGLHTFATQSAPRNIGLLQTIQQLADKTLVGPGASKIQFVNGVLNTMGITPGADQAQNYQIMKKNLNMLVGSQRMGAGGGGTDALQALLEASNPNVAEMNGPAAKEAAEELIAYNRMIMAHDRLMPNPLKTTTDQYQTTETKLAPYRDPRIWQMEHAQNDDERKRILSLMPATERAAFLSKAAEARKLGLLN